MKGDKNHKTGCLWYEMQIKKINVQINNLLERRKIVFTMMMERHKNQKSSQLIYNKSKRKDK